MGTLKYGGVKIRNRGSCEEWVSGSSQGEKLVAARCRMLAETVATASQRGHESDVVRLNHASEVPTQPGRSSSAPCPEGDRVWAGRSAPDRAKQRSKTDSQLADGRKQTTGRWVRAWGWPTPTLVDEESSGGKRKRPRPLRPLPFAFHSVVVGDPRSRSGNSPRVSHSRGRPQTRGGGWG